MKSLFDSFISLNENDSALTVARLGQVYVFIIEKFESNEIRLIQYAYLRKRVFSELIQHEQEYPCELFFKKMSEVDDSLQPSLASLVHNIKSYEGNSRDTMHSLNSMLEGEIKQKYQTSSTYILNEEKLEIIKKYITQFSQASQENKLFYKSINYGEEARHNEERYYDGRSWIRNGLAQINLSLSHDEDPDFFNLEASGSGSAVVARHPVKPHIPTEQQYQGGFFGQFLSKKRAKISDDFLRAILEDNVEIFLRCLSRNEDINNIISPADSKKIVALNSNNKKIALNDFSGFSLLMLGIYAGSIEVVNRLLINTSGLDLNYSVTINNHIITAMDIAILMENSKLCELFFDLDALHNFSFDIEENKKIAKLLVCESVDRSNCNIM